MIDPDNLANAVAIEGGKVQNYWKEREAKGWVPSYYDNDQGALGTFADAFMGGLETTVGEGLLGVGAALNYVSDDGSDFGNSLINLGNELNQHNAQYNIYRGEAPDPREDFLSYLYDKHGLVADAGQTIGSSAPGLIAGLALGPIGTGPVIGGIAAGVAAGSEMAANVGSDWQDTMQNKYGDAGYNTLNMQWNPETAEAFGQNWTGENASKGVELLASSLMDTAIDIGTGAGTFGLGKVASALGKSTKGADLLASAAAGGEKVTQKVMGTGLRKAALEVAGHATESALGEGLQEAWQQRVQDNIVKNQGEVGDFFTSVPWSGWSDDEQKAFLQAALPSLFTGGLASTGRHIANKLAKDDAENQLGNAMQKEEEGAKADMRQENIEAGRDENAGIDEIGADLESEDTVNRVIDVIGDDINNGNNMYSDTDAGERWDTVEKLHPDLFSNMSPEQKQKARDMYIARETQQQQEQQEQQQTQAPEVKQEGQEATTPATTPDEKQTAEELKDILAKSQDHVNQINAQAFLKAQADAQAFLKAQADEAAGKQPQKLSAYGGIILDMIGDEPSHEQLLDLYRQDHEMDDATYNRLKAQAVAEDNARRKASTPTSGNTPTPPSPKPPAQTTTAPVTADTLTQEQADKVLGNVTMPINMMTRETKEKIAEDYNKMPKEQKPEKTNEAQPPAGNQQPNTAQPVVTAPAKPKQQEQAINQPNENKAQAPAPVKVEQKPRDKYEGYWQNIETKSDGSIGKIPGLPSKLTTSVNTALKYMKKHGVDSGRLGKVREAFKQASKDGTQWRITDEGVVQHRQPNSTLDHDIETLKGTIHNAAFDLEEARQRAAAGDKTAQGQVADKERVLNNAITKAKGKLTDEEVQAAQANIATGVQEKLERERNKTKPDGYTTEQVKTEQQPTPVSSSTPTEKNSPDARSTPPVEKVTRDDIPKIKKELTELMRQENAAQDPELRKSLQKKWIKLVATKLIIPFGNDEARRIFVEAQIDAKNSPEVDTNGTESKQTEGSQNSEEKRGSIGEGAHASETPSNQGQKTEDSHPVEAEPTNDYDTDTEESSKQSKAQHDKLRNILDPYEKDDDDAEPKIDPMKEARDKAIQDGAKIVNKELNDTNTVIDVGADTATGLDGFASVFNNLSNSTTTQDDVSGEADAYSEKYESAPEDVDDTKDTKQAKDEYDNSTNTSKAGGRQHPWKASDTRKAIKNLIQAAGVVGKKLVQKIELTLDSTNHAQKQITMMGTRFVPSHQEVNTILSQYEAAKRKLNKAGITKEERAAAKEEMARRRAQIFAYTLRPCMSHAMVYSMDNINDMAKLLYITTYCIDKAIDTFDPTKAVWSERMQKAVAGPSMVSYVNALVDAYAKRSRQVAMAHGNNIDLDKGILTDMKNAPLIERSVNVKESDESLMESARKYINEDGKFDLNYYMNTVYSYISQYVPYKLSEQIEDAAEKSRGEMFKNGKLDYEKADEVYSNILKQIMMKNLDGKVSEQELSNMFMRLIKLMGEVNGEDYTANYENDGLKSFISIYGYTKTNELAVDDILKGMVDTVRKGVKQGKATVKDEEIVLQIAQGVSKIDWLGRKNTLEEFTNRVLHEHYREAVGSYISYISDRQKSNKINSFALAIKRSSLGKQLQKDMSDADIIETFKNILVLPDNEYIQKHEEKFEVIKSTLKDIYNNEMELKEKIDIRRSYNDKGGNQAAENAVLLAQAKLWTSYDAFTKALNSVDFTNEMVAVSTTLATDKKFDSIDLEKQLAIYQTPFALTKILGYDKYLQNYDVTLKNILPKLKNVSPACGTLVAHLLIAKQTVANHISYVYVEPDKKTKSLEASQGGDENGRKNEEKIQASDTPYLYLENGLKNRGRGLYAKDDVKGFVKDLHDMCDILSLDAYIDTLISTNSTKKSDGKKYLSVKAKAMYATTGVINQIAADTRKKLLLMAEDNANQNKNNQPEIDRLDNKIKDMTAMLHRLTAFEYRTARPIWDRTMTGRYLRFEKNLRQDLDNPVKFAAWFDDPKTKITLKELNKASYETFNKTFDKLDDAVKESERMRKEEFNGTLEVLRDRFKTYDENGKTKREVVHIDDIYTKEKVERFIEEAGLPHVELLDKDGVMSFEKDKDVDKNADKRKVYHTYLKYIASMAVLCSGKSDMLKNFNAYDMLRFASQNKLMKEDFVNFVNMLNAFLKLVVTDDATSHRMALPWFRLMPFSDTVAFRRVYFAVRDVKDKDGNTFKSIYATDTKDKSELNKVDNNGLLPGEIDPKSAKHLFGKGTQDMEMRWIRVDKTDKRYHAEDGTFEGYEVVHVPRELADRSDYGEWNTAATSQVSGLNFGMSSFFDTFYQLYTHNARAIRLYQALRKTGIDLTTKENANANWVVEGNVPRFYNTTYELYDYINNNILPQALYKDVVTDGKNKSKVHEITAIWYDKREQSDSAKMKTVTVKVQQYEDGSWHRVGNGTKNEGNKERALIKFLNLKESAMRISKQEAEKLDAQKAANAVIDAEEQYYWDRVNAEQKETLDIVKNNVDIFLTITNPDGKKEDIIDPAGNKIKDAKDKYRDDKSVQLYKETVAMYNILHCLVRNKFPIGTSWNMAPIIHHLLRPFRVEAHSDKGRQIILTIEKAKFKSADGHLLFVTQEHSDVLSKFLVSLYRVAVAYNNNQHLRDKGIDTTPIIKAIVPMLINKNAPSNYLDKLASIFDIGEIGTGNAESGGVQIFNNDELNFYHDLLAAAMELSVVYPSTVSIPIKQDIDATKTSTLFRPSENVKKIMNGGSAKNVAMTTQTINGTEREAVILNSTMIDDNTYSRIMADRKSVDNTITKIVVDEGRHIEANYSQVGNNMISNMANINRDNDATLDVKASLPLYKKLLSKLLFIHGSEGLKKGIDGIIKDLIERPKNAFFNNSYVNAVKNLCKCLQFLKKRGWFIMSTNDSGGGRTGHMISFSSEDPSVLFHEVSHAILSYTSNINDIILSKFDSESNTIDSAKTGKYKGTYFDSIDSRPNKSERHALTQKDIEQEAKRLATVLSNVTFGDKDNIIYNKLIKWVSNIPVSHESYKGMLELFSRSGLVYYTVDKNGNKQIRYCITPQALNSVITRENHKKLVTIGNTDKWANHSWLIEIQPAARHFFTCAYCAKLLSDADNYGMSEPTEHLFQESINYTINDLLDLTAPDLHYRTSYIGTSVGYEWGKGLIDHVEDSKQLDVMKDNMGKLTQALNNVYQIYGEEIDKFVDIEDTLPQSMPLSIERSEELRDPEPTGATNLQERPQTTVGPSKVPDGAVPFTLHHELDAEGKAAAAAIRANNKSLTGKVLNSIAELLWNTVARFNAEFDTTGDHVAAQHRSLGAFWNRIWKPRSAVVRDILRKSGMTPDKVRHILVLCTRCISMQEQNNVLVDQRIQDVVHLLTVDPKTGKKLPAKERLYNIRYFNHIINKSDEFARPLYCKKLLCPGYSDREYVQNQAAAEAGELLEVDTSWSDKFRIFENYDLDKLNNLANYYRHHGYKFAEVFENKEAGFAILFATNHLKDGKPLIHRVEGKRFTNEQDKLAWRRENIGYFNDFFGNKPYIQEGEKAIDYMPKDGDDPLMFEGEEYKRLFDKETEGRDRLIEFRGNTYRVRGYNEERSLLGLLHGVYKDKDKTGYAAFTPELARAWLEYNHIQQDLYASEMIRESGDTDSLNALHTGYLEGRKPHVIGRYLVSKWVWNEKDKNWMVFGVGSFMKYNEMRNYVKEHYSGTKTDYHIKDAKPHPNNPENLREIIVMSTSQKTLGGGGGFSISGWDRDTTVYGDKELENIAHEDVVTAVNRLNAYVADAFQIRKQGKAEDLLPYKKSTLIRSIEYTLAEMRQKGEGFGYLYSNFDPNDDHTQLQQWKTRLTRGELEQMLALAKRMKEVDGAGHKVETWQDFIDHMSKQGTKTMASRWAHHRTPEGNQAHLELVNAVDALKIYGHSVANYNALTPFVKEFSSLIYKLAKKEYGPGRDRGITIYNELSDFLDLFQGHPTTMDGFIRATSFMLAEGLRKIPVIGNMLQTYGFDLSDYWLPDTMNYLMQFQIPAKLGCFNLASGIAQCNQLFNIVALYGWKEFGKAFNQTKTVWGQMAKGAKGQFDPETLAANDKDGIVREVIKDMGITDVGDSFNRNNTGDFVAQDNLFAKLPTKVQEGIEKSMIFFRMGDAGCRVVAIQAAVNHMDHDAKFQQELKAIKEGYKGKDQKELDKAIRQAKIDYAEQFVNDTQFAFNRTSDPYIVQKMGLLGRFLTQFSKYGFATIDFLANTCTNWKQRATILGLGGMFAGISGAIPAYSFFVGIASAMGADADNWIKELLAKLVSEYHMPKAAAEAMGYGVLAPLLGVDISRKVGFQDIVRDPTDPTSFFGPSVNTLRNGVNAICTIPGFATDKYTWDEVMFAFLKDVPVFSNTFQIIRGQHYKYNKFTAKDSPQSMDMAERARKLLGFADVRNSELNDMSRAIWEAQQEYSNEAKEAQIAFVHNPTEENRKRLIELGKNPEKLKRMDWTLPSQLKRTTNAKTQAAERNRQTITNYANFAGVNPTGLL